ncbi:UBX domain-containing protein 8 [Spea bombifrons]|uniref:UBX domain-containing protein 8 n=1 Tax=Spea bombifrons TaxID=233779 RepID=UPI0023499FD7|nr:UBX domain-containing protein 8 [Spea bombifrons]
MTGAKTWITCLLLILLFIWMGSASRPGEVVLWTGKFIFLISVLTLIISFVTPWISSFRRSRKSHMGLSVPEGDMEQQQKLVRIEQQEQLKQKASYYVENIMKPREESRLKRKMEHFYRMTGQSWKLTEGHMLGDGEGHDSLNNCDATDKAAETPNNEALRKRKLPEQATKPIPKLEPPPPKKIITLPEEPNEPGEGVISVALRCPSGRVFRRRFYKSCCSLVLQDWMMKLGYHSVFYALYTSSPRCQVELKTELSIENIGIIKDTLLNIEQNYS